MGSKIHDKEMLILGCHYSGVCGHCADILGFILSPLNKLQGGHEEDSDGNLEFT